jgi:hypothetical protein
MTGIVNLMINNVKPVTSQNIVTTNLSLYLNAQNYSGSGTSWTASNGSNATLFNTPTYTSASPTYFSFDPTAFEYATVPNIGSLTNWTVESWTMVTSNLTSPTKITSIICNQFNGVSNLNYSLGTNNAPTNYNLTVGFYDGAWRNVSGFTPTLNVWYHLVGTYDGATIKLYVNNSLNSQTTYSGTPQSGGEVRIARRWDSSDVDNINFFPGRVAVARIYSTALNASQVTQNWNAERSRFGY